ncbi:MAG: AIR synthase-related protein [Candidatus Pacebacteria bacterium]|jgi:phosphoribosylformylglycinamidine cyclo-ligase|nr:AIR synthase-related protein [Candidatus Paceibacterota bacterium]
MANIYKESGVDYGRLDQFKRAAQYAGSRTNANIDRLGIRNLAESRGESVALFDCGSHYLAHVEEGLGTKNLVADAMRAKESKIQLPDAKKEKTYYDAIAQDTLAMIVNDMVTLGALPVSAAMLLAVGNSDWFDDTKRSGDLAKGWRKACDLAGCVWSGGETPAMKGVLMPDACLVSGSAAGIIKPKSKRIKGNIKDGDAIVFIEASGIHANGLTLARQIAAKLPQGFFTEIPGTGKNYGETLLAPTPIYVKAVEGCQKAGIDIHYAVNITGHGWRKLMRLDAPFAYIVERLPKQLPIFDFMQKHGQIPDEEMYADFNMGAGFALYVDKKNAQKVEAIARELRLTAFEAGHIESSKTKKVTIKPKNIEYAGKTLQVR